MNRHDLAHAVRERLVRYPDPFASHYGVVPAPPPENAIAIGDARALLEKANAALGRATAWGRDLHDPWVSSRILARREAVSSSAIEGTQSTLDDLLAAEETEAQAAGATGQVRDYASCLDLFVPRAGSGGPDIFTPDLLQDLHRAVMRGDADYRDRPGEFRREVVYIGAAGRGIAYSTFNPPPPDRVAECVGDNLSYMRLEGMQAVTQGLITRMAVAHAHFEAVHPFKDGNGRTGRLLLPLMMVADRQPALFLSPYIEANKPAYYEALRRAQQRLDWAAAIGFMAAAVSGTVAEMAATREALERLKALWRSRRRFRQGSTALRSLDMLPHYPVITINRLASLLGVSFPAAATAVSQLREAGILRERTGYARHRIFTAPEALSLINRPFGAVPVLAPEDGG